MQIKELAAISDMPPKTIRYYEDVGILPKPDRYSNGYRKYSHVDVERLRLVAGARHLDISLKEIREILDMRDRDEAPCTMLLKLLEQKTIEIDKRIQELKSMRTELDSLYHLGLTYPTDDVEGKNCVCHLVSETRNSEA